MSAKVNVLASLRDAKECLINAGIDHHELTLSIAAIAELIDAAYHAERCLPWADPQARRLRAALAAVGGEGQ